MEYYHIFGSLRGICKALTSILELLVRWCSPKHGYFVPLIAGTLGPMTDLFGDLGSCFETTKSNVLRNALACYDEMPNNPWGVAIFHIFLTPEIAMTCP